MRRKGVKKHEKNPCNHSSPHSCVNIRDSGMPEAGGPEAGRVIRRDLDDNDGARRSACNGT
jgi:hypothetical protein